MKSQRFCSRACGVIYKNRKNNGTLDRYMPNEKALSPLSLTCQHCKREFVRERFNLFCSRKCRSANAAPTSRSNDLARRANDYRAFIRALGTSIKIAARSGRRAKYEITTEQLISLYEKQGGKCALTGFEMTTVVGKGYVPTNISVDRIDNALGYTENNVRLVCRLANQMKHTLSDSELIRWCEAIVRLH